MGVIGAVVLLFMILVWRKMKNKAPIKLSGKTIGAMFIGIVGALLLGVGMCLTMVWSNMIVGIVIERYWVQIIKLNQAFSLIAKIVMYIFMEVWIMRKFKVLMSTYLALSMVGFMSIL